VDRWFRSAPQPTSLGSLIVPNLSPNKVLGEGPSRPRLLAFKKPRLIPGLFVLREERINRYENFSISGI
jgi:hypothetical protein